MDKIKKNGNSTDKATNTSRQSSDSSLKPATPKDTAEQNSSPELKKDSEKVKSDKKPSSTHHKNHHKDPAVHPKFFKDANEPGPSKSGLVMAMPKKGARSMAATSCALTTAPSTDEYDKLMQMIYMHEHDDLPKPIDPDHMPITSRYLLPVLSRPVYGYWDCFSRNFVIVVWVLSAIVGAILIVYVVWIIIETYYF